MKNFYKVSNIIVDNPIMDRKRTVVGPMKDRVKSRMSPINHRLWTVIAPMLFIAFGLFGVNVEMWGKKKTDGTVTIKDGKGTVTITAYYKSSAAVTRTGATGSISTVDNMSNIGVAKNVAYNDRKDTEDGWLTFEATATTGYTFYGWCTKSDCSDANPNTSKSYRIDEERTGWFGALHNDLTVILYTKFVPIKYNIAYNGNTSTSGSMSKTEVEYDGDVTLRSNAFKKKQCTVTFNANGGSGAPSSLDVNYPFLGWATSSAGNVEYENGETIEVPNFRDETNCTTDYVLYAKWGSTTTPITLPTVEKSGFSFAGWYSDSGLTNKVNNAGAEYNPSSNITLYAKWTKEAAEPSFAGTGFVNGNKGLKVGEGYSSFTFTNTSTPVPSASTSANFYYVISNTNVTTSNTTNSPDGSKVIGVEYDGNTTIIRALNQGTADITFYQQPDASNNIAVGESETYTFTVTKNNPVFTWPNSGTYYCNNTKEHFFKSNQTTTTISMSSSNSGIAEVIDSALVTYNIVGTTRITMSQAENYYWNNYSEYRDITVAKADKHVEFTIGVNSESLYNALESGNAHQGVHSWDGGVKVGEVSAIATNDDKDKYVILGPFEGIPDQFSCDYSCTDLASGRDWRIYESSNGSSWDELMPKKTSAGSFSKGLKSTTRYLKLLWSGNYAGYFSNIRVTELQYFRRQGENTTLDFATNVKNHVPAVQSFVVEHANAGYQTSVTAPSHYQVSLDNVNFASEVVYSTNATALTGGDKMGTFTVYVKYLADAEGTHAGNVVVHNNLRADFNVPVTGTTKDKIATQIEYCGASSYSVDAANIASTTLFRVRDTDNDTIVTGVGVSLSCEENEQFSIAGGNALDPECGGTNNVKPSFAGNDTYAAATNNNANFAITITRLADEINFDNARSTLVVEDEIDLSDWASAESESEITYAVMSSDQLTGSIKIENGKLIALSAGTVRIKATSEGNCLYDSGYDFHNMKVRNPGDPCGSLLLDKSATVKCGVTAKTSESPQEYAISAGPMDELKFKIWRVTAAGDQVTIRFVDKDGNAVPNGTYTYSAGSLGTSKPDSYTVIDVSNITGATKLQIYGGGLLNKYVSNVQITQKAYLTTYVGSTQLEPTANVTMPEVKACNTSTKDITIKYSDLTPIQLSHTNDVFTYEIYKGENKVGFFDNDCRGFGTYTVRCICTPTSKGEYSDVLTLTASGQSQTINLSLNATAPDRTIVWDIPTGNTITATQSLDLTAYAETSCQSPAGSIYYTASPADAVTIDPIDGNHITFKKAASVTVTAHTVASDDYNDALPVDKVWTVGKIGTQMRTLPTITSTITYGDNSSVVTYDNNSWVAEDTLNHEVVTGIIVYNGPASFDAAGPQDLSFYFYPTVNAQTYDVCLFTVPVTVQKATTTASANAIVLTYGETPDSKALSTASAALEGIWSWNDDHSDDILNASADAYVLNVTFTPNNTNYYPYETTVNVTVNKANPAATVENVSFAYGTKAEDVTLVGTGAGEWTWTDSRKGQTLTVGEYEMDVHFAPTDDANYNAIDTKITLTVTKANPVASVENVSFVYGTKADDVTLVGTGEGTWSWTDSRKDQVLTVGEYEMDVHFAPTDDANYNAIDKTITLTVTKANPAATVENVSFAYGTKAEDVALSGTGAGTWTWTDSRKGQTLTVGEYEMDVHFAPTDDANYNTIDTKITLTVTKANPVATANAVEITYGATASSVTLSGTGVAGTWSWTDSRKDQVLAAGSYTMDVHFVPTEATNYNEKDATVALTVKKATTTLSWTSNPTDLAYNATDAVYTATSASDGAITYSIISGGSYAHIHANTGALTIDVPGNTITIQAEQAEGTNYSAPTAITVEVTIAAAPVGPNRFTGNGEWENPSNWSTGIVPTTAEPDIIVVGQLVINEEKTIGGLTIMPTGGVTIVDDGKLTVNGASADQSGYGDLYVANGGEVEVAGSLTVRDLIVEASIGTSEGNAESGQVASAENIVYTNAYIDINMDPEGHMDDTKWYGFTVPFAVDAYNGVSRLEGTTYRQCGYGVHYMIAEYDANKRLNTGNGWKYISGNTLNAGQFYFFTVGDGSYNTYRFKASGNSYTPAAAASLNVNGPTTNYDANWNGVGNSTLQHVTASYYGGEYVQVFMNGQDAYKTVSTNDANFVVGCPFFIQAKEATTLLLSGKNTLVDKYYAPRRMQAEATAVSRINLSATDGGYSDQIYFSAVDKEQDAYIIGQDLSKAGESKVVPQLWMAQYNQKLSVHEAAWNGDRATCPVGIYVPKSGEFVLTATQPEDGTQIYLTENGAPIWDLTMSEYVLSLEKGNTSSYGLMIVRAPQVTTGVEDVQGAGAEVRKVIIDNTMYIITPEGTMFNVIGKKVQ